jgi:hypothetical protein
MSNYLELEADVMEHVGKLGGTHVTFLPKATVTLCSPPSVDS